LDLNLESDYILNSLDFYRQHHGQQLYYLWQGEVWGQLAPEAEYQLLFGLLGMNATKVFIRPDPEHGEVGYRINRELGLYCHPQTQAVKTAWQLTPEHPVVPVVHIANRIVQGALSPKQTVIPAGQAYVAAVTEFPLTYPHPLAADPQYRDYCPGPEFQGTEYFTSHLCRPGATQVPAATWARDCPWLPWMKLGYGHPARLKFKTTIQRLEAFEQLPSRLVELIRSRVPIYEFTPDHSDEANMTSTLYFRQHFPAYLDGREFPISETV
jgi:Protein of unknown function (DUF1838)